MAISDNFSDIQNYSRLDPIATVNISGEELRFSVPNMLIAGRVATILSKEPETIAWIDQIAESDIFFDVGANVGIYTIYASIVRKSRVYAFEPEASNFSILNRNIKLNKLTSCVAYPIALSNTNRLDILHINNPTAGESGHHAGHSIDIRLNPKESRFQQGTSLRCLDMLIKNQEVPLPKFLKIDVDGLEHYVIDGSTETLSGSNLKSVLIELNADFSQHKRVIQKMHEFGFKFDNVQVNKSKKTSGWNKGQANFIFFRV